MSNYEIFEIKLQMAMLTKLYNANLITYDKYISTREYYSKQLIDK
jgi:hypothetical protein